MRQNSVFIILMLVLTFPCFSQTLTPFQESTFQQNRPGGPGTPEAASEEELTENSVDRLQLAISNESYPVTPGDVYRLTFTTAGNLITNQIIVESDYTINLGVLGIVDVKNMSFPQLKKRVEKLVMEGYPRSLPSIIMISTGTFQIPVLGEVPQTRYVIAWGLSRLNTVLFNVLGRHSSIRNIRIVNRDGITREYDLWKALNLGQLEQNPIVHPGDRIEIARVVKEITINGEVYREGTYQLKERESLQDIAYFSGGFTPLADLQRVAIERYSGEKAKLIVMDFTDYDGDFQFEDNDVITIPSKKDDTLQVTVVGAVYSPGRYTYTPPEGYQYYINLAGGADYERNTGNAVLITDRFGNEKDPGYPIAAGDTVTVLNNKFCL